MKRRTSITIGIAFAAFASVQMLPVSTPAQSNQLMLADILIALRSKKVPLNERNDIISKAVAVRGITFSLTPEIEKELSDTGAARELLDAIRQKAPIVKVSAAVPQPDVKPKQEPVAPPPDASFYQAKAEGNLARADYDGAIADYSKAIELNPTWVGLYLGRADAYSHKQSLPEALRDYDKVLELKPDNAVAHFRRGALLEQKGDPDQAIVAYQKAFTLDPANSAAKTAADRLLLEKQKTAKAAEAAVAVTPPAKAPEFLQLGALSKDQAVNLVMPSIPATVSRANVSGQVTVDLTIDEEGRVVTAKAVNGLAFLRANSEAAALRSRFKPQTFNGIPVKSKGSITYNFTNGR